MRTLEVLARFEEPTLLVDMLTSRDASFDEKDAVYAGLVSIAQAHGEDAELAVSLIWLGLWPKLDQLYRRRLRHFGGDGDELAAEINRQFTIAVRRADLQKITRMGATLVHNTDRRVGDMARKEWRRSLANQADAGKVEARSREPAPDESVADALKWLRHMCGADVDVLLSIVVDGNLPAGTSVQTVRKRVQRARDRLKAEIDVDRKKVGHVFLRTTALRGHETTDRPCAHSPPRPVAQARERVHRSGR